MDPTELDAIDRAILGELATNGRASWRDLGGRIGLSPNATADRVRRLEERGVITGYSATVDRARVGRGLEAVVAVKLQPGTDKQQVEEFLAEQPAVTGAVHLTGADDYLVEVAARDPAEIDALLVALKEEHGVAETHTRVVLRRICP